MKDDALIHIAQLDRALVTFGFELADHVANFLMFVHHRSRTVRVELFFENDHVRWDDLRESCGYGGLDAATFAAFEKHYLSGDWR